jgi:hypothetical protein
MTQKLLPLYFLLLAIVPAAMAQPVDPASNAVWQEWQASELQRGHLAEALQKLMQAYSTAQEKQKAVDVYWQNYVAGLTSQSGNR